MKGTIGLVVTLGTSLAAIAPLCAQSPKSSTSTPSSSPSAKAAEVSTTPQVTTATYGDWLLRCQRVTEDAKAQNHCEVGQSVQVQGQGLIAQIAFGHPAKGEPMHLTVLLPSNVSFPGVPKVYVEKETTGPELIWRRCMPGGCLANLQLPAEVLTRWRGQIGNGRLEFADALGRKIEIPFSFRGLAQALDALPKQ